MNSIKQACPECNKEVKTLYRPNMKHSGPKLCYHCNNKRIKREKEEAVKQNASYTEWYQMVYKEPWTDNHAPLNSLLDDYEDWCKERNIEPIWNG